MLEIENQKLRQEYDRLAIESSLGKPELHGKINFRCLFIFFLNYRTLFSFVCRFVRNSKKRNRTSTGRKYHVKITFG